jgi:hypothetical protein
MRDLMSPALRSATAPNQRHRFTPLIAGNRPPSLGQSVKSPTVREGNSNRATGLFAAAPHERCPPLRLGF